MSIRPAILLSTYGSHAAEGRNLGSAGYSYDFVVRQFAPHLAQCGELVELPPDRDVIERAADRARQLGLTPIHLCFMPFQHAVLCESAPNVVVPAWEFPDVPDDEFDGEPRNNWVATANRCAGAIVGGPWTAENFRRAGIRVPIHVVPVPTPAWNFALPEWRNGTEISLECPAIDCGKPFSPISYAAATGGDISRTGDVARRGGWRAGLWRGMGSAARQAYKRIARPLLPARLEESFAAAVHAAAGAWRRPRDYSALDCLELSGVVYTSIFNPDDGRKNWEDLVSAFLLALGDCPDATLVLKLVVRDRRAAAAVVAHCARLDLEHRCRLLVITDFLNREQMRHLARATTYYVTSTRAEGNCLPLMDYLAAGRPAVSPRHTALIDYFGDHVGFVVQSHPEPAAWPQDSRRRCRTTWQRLVWTSLAEELRRSYDVARNDPAAYQQLSRQARRTMREWSHPDVVETRLRSALETMVGDGANQRDSGPDGLEFGDARAPAA